MDDDEEEDESDKMGRNENINAAIVVDSLLNKEYSDIDEVFDVGEAFIHQKGFTAENRNRNQETKNQDLNPVKKLLSVDDDFIIEPLEALMSTTMSKPTTELTMETSTTSTGMTRSIEMH